MSPDRQPGLLSGGPCVICGRTLGALGVHQGADDAEYHAYRLATRQLEQAHSSVLSWSRAVAEHEVRSQFKAGDIYHWRDVTTHEHVTWTRDAAGVWTASDGRTATDADIRRQLAPLGPRQ